MDGIDFGPGSIGEISDSLFGKVNDGCGDKLN